MLLAVGRTPGIPDSVGLRRGLRICTSTKYPADAEAAGTGAPPGEPR